VSMTSRGTAHIGLGDESCAQTGSHPLAWKTSPDATDRRDAESSPAWCA